MGSTRKNYKTTRNKKTNEFLGGFANPGDKNYNKNIMKKFFVSENKLTEWEKEFYESVKKQDFNITDNQFKIIHKIYLNNSKSKK